MKANFEKGKLHRPKKLNESEIHFELQINKLILAKFIH